MKRMDAKLEVLSRPAKRQAESDALLYSEKLNRWTYLTYMVRKGHTANNKQTVYRMNEMTTEDIKIIYELAVEGMDEESISVAMDKLEEVRTVPRPPIDDLLDPDWRQFVAFCKDRTCNRWPAEPILGLDIGW